MKFNGLNKSFRQIWLHLSKIFLADEAKGRKDPMKTPAMLGHLLGALNLVRLGWLDYISLGKVSLIWFCKASSKIKINKLIHFPTQEVTKLTLIAYKKFDLLCTGPSIATLGQTQSLPSTCIPHFLNKFVNKKNIFP